MYSHPPLGKRIVKARLKPNIFDCETSLTFGCRGTYRRWDDINMENAVKAVEQCESIRRAAEIFSIPKSTLHDRLTGKVLFGARSGPDPYLTCEEEEELASFLIRAAKIGYPHTKKQVLALVQQMVATKGIDTTITNGWWERFRQRHPKLTLKAAVPLSYARAMATDQDVLSRYFDMLEDCLKGNGIFNRPANIFNCDETGLPLNPKCLKVIDEVGSKNPSYLTGNSKSQITVLACTSAAGYALPPFVIFARKSINPALTKGEVPGTLYGLSETGWMNRELFNHWLIEHFLLYAPPTRPLLLLLDGHSTHYCPETIKVAAENEVIMCALPPHTTHLTQPLDRGCFAPLKVVWRQVCHEFSVQNPGKVVTQYEFCSLFAKAWYKALSMENIIGGFRVTGVFPFDRSVIKRLIPSEEEEEFLSFKRETLLHKTGLAYVPLYSPVCSRSSHISTYYPRPETSITSTPYQSSWEHSLVDLPSQKRPLSFSMSFLQEVS